MPARPDAIHQSIARSIIAGYSRRGFGSSEKSPRSSARANACRNSPSLDTLTSLCAGLQLRRSTLFLSFEENDRDFDRELADLLGSRSLADRALGLRVVRFVFALLAELDSAT